MGDPEIQRVGPGHELRMILDEERGSKWEPGPLGGGTQTPETWGSVASALSRSSFFGNTRCPGWTGRGVQLSGQSKPGPRWPPTISELFCVSSALLLPVREPRPPRPPQGVPSRQAPRGLGLSTSLGSQRRPRAPGSGAVARPTTVRGHGAVGRPLAPGPAAGPHPKIVPGEQKASPSFCSWCSPWPGGGQRGARAPSRPHKSRVRSFHQKVHPGRGAASLRRTPASSFQGLWPRFFPIRAECSHPGIRFAPPGPRQLPRPALRDAGGRRALLL